MSMAPQVTNAWNGDALQRRATWLRILTKWHWISSALCLVGMLFFATTGFMLNNAEYFERATPVVTQHSATLPPAILGSMNVMGNGQGLVLPESVLTWVHDSWGMSLSPQSTDWRADEVFVDLKRPGVDAWLSIDRKTGTIQYEADDRGWVAFFNDLHKGKNAGKAWGGFISLFGMGCIVFCVTGLLILAVHAKSRWSIWPVTGLGFVLPLLIVLIFVH